MSSKTIKRRTLPEHVAPLTGIPGFLDRVYRQRGVVSTDELALGLSELADNSALKGVSAAVSLLVESLSSGDKILVVGDFDADGATSTALAVDALTAMGAKGCQYLVPNRFEFGYGLSPEIVELAAEQKPQLIITVDNGIASHEGVIRAQDFGIKVLVTDHHLPGDTLPDADAIVNPNQPGCDFISKNAAGVGVVFYLLSALRTALRQNGWFQQQGLSEPNMADYLDLVALGTVADLVPLDRNNRILVEQGLRRMRAGRCRPGIAAILGVANKRPEAIVASDLGFLVGPRLNAAGRLDDMSRGIACLLAQTPSQATELALQLDQLNQQRKSIESEMKQDAETQLQAMTLDKSNQRWGVCMYQAHWHQGVIGILASRIKEQLHRPVIIFAAADDDPLADNFELKGSARSIPGLHMRDALDLVAKQHPQLLKKFGGHAMAAGMTISANDFEDFADAFDKVVRDLLTEQDLDSVLMSDGELSESELELDKVELLARSGPWGQQFPEPAFDGVFRVIQSRILKDKHLKLVLSAQHGQQLFDAIQFNSGWVDRALPELVRVVYRPNINEFRGRKSVQFLLDYIEPA